jgi:hypothetical protein
MKKTVILLSMFLAACATITHGPNETIAVDSQPSGAAASIKCDGGVNVSGTTPAKLVIPRKADHCVVEVSNASRTKSVKLLRGYSGRYWANFSWASTIPAGALLSFSGGNDVFEAGLVAGAGLTGAGFLVDWLSGAMYDRDMHEVTIDLEH